MGAEGGKHMETKDILLDLRTRRGLSQGELAEKVFVTRQAVSRWETGETVPNTETLKLLSGLYNVSINTLLGSPRKLVCQCCGMPLEDPILGRNRAGSLSEAVSVLCGTGKPLLIVPAGSGNDFARTLALPAEPLAALCAQLDGSPAAIDCGLLNGRPFLNVSGFGLDAQVLERAEALKAEYPGGRAYRRAVSDVIVHFEPCCPALWIDGVRQEPRRYTIVEAANGRYFGGGMKVAPGADVRDGLFDAVLVRAVPKALIPALLPAFVTGWHTRLRLAKVIRARSLTIRNPGMTVNIDGRLEKMDEARYEICPGGLQVRLPERGAC